MLSLRSLIYLWYMLVLTTLSFTAADLIWVWPMLGWCIVTLAGARLKASVRFPPLRGMYQRGTYNGCDTKTALFWIQIMIARTFWKFS